MLIISITRHEQYLRLSLIPIAELVNAFNEYAREKRLSSATSNKAFGIAMLDQMIVPMETSHPKVGERQVEAWSGISLRKDIQ